MSKHPIKHFVTNMICGFIPNKDKRKHVRVLLNSDFRKCVKFVRRDMGTPVHKIKTFIGYGANNLLIAINDEWIYKFPLCGENPNELAQREARIVDALAPYSPISIPSVTLRQMGNVTVRKYPYVRGTHIMNLPLNVQIEQRKNIATQVAQFLYDVGCADPEQIRDLKPTPDATPGFMCGWCQYDTYGNFMVDEKTFRINAFIDFEGAKFCDFSDIFTRPHHPESQRQMAAEFMAVVKSEYEKIWNKNHK